MTWEIYIDGEIHSGSIVKIVEELNNHSEAIIRLPRSPENIELVQSDRDVDIYFDDKKILSGKLMAAKFKYDYIECTIYPEAEDKLKNSIITGTYEDASPETVAQAICDAAGLTLGSAPSTPTVSVRFDHAVCWDALRHLCDVIDKDFWFDGSTVYIGDRGTSVGEIVPQGLSRRAVDRSKVKNKVIIRGVDKDGNTIYGVAQTGAGDRVIVFTEKRTMTQENLNQLAQTKLKELSKEATGVAFDVSPDVGVSLNVGDTVYINAEELNLVGNFRIYRLTRKAEKTIVEIDRPELVLESVFEDMQRLEDLGIYPVSAEQLDNPPGPPAAPTGLTATPQIGAILLKWNANTEADLDHYEIYRDTSSPASTKIAEVHATSYLDEDVEYGVTYYYRIKAVDRVGNKSDFSAEVSASPRQVETPDLEDQSITTDKIVPEAVTTPILAPDAVTTEKIQDQAVTELKLADLAVSTLKIQDLAITETKIADDSISTPKLQANAVTAAKIAAGAVTTEKLDAHAVTTRKLYVYQVLLDSPGFSASGGVLSWNSFTLTYQGVDYEISSGSTSDMYIYWKEGDTFLSSSNTKPDIASDPSIHMIAVFDASTNTFWEVWKPTVVHGGMIITETISTEELAADAVTTEKIRAEAVTTAKLAAGAVTSEKITADWITGKKFRTSGRATPAAGVEFDDNGIRGYGDATTKTFEIEAATGDVKVYGSQHFIVADETGTSIGYLEHTRYTFDSTDYDTARLVAPSHSAAIEASGYYLLLRQDGNWIIGGDPTILPVSDLQVRIGDNSHRLKEIHVESLYAENLSGTINILNSDLDANSHKIYNLSGLEPDGTGTRDIGTSTLQWKDGYFAGTVYGGSGDFGSLLIGGTEVITGSRVLQNIASINVNLLPSDNDFFDLGSESYKWHRLFLGSTDVGLNAGGSIVIGDDTSNLRIDDNEIQQYGNSLYINIDSHVDTIFGCNVRPHSDNAYDLGSSSYQWRNLYLGNQLIIGGDVVLYRGGTNILETDDQFRIRYAGSWDQLVFDTTSADSRIAKVKVGSSNNWLWLDAYADTGYLAVVGFFRGVVDGKPRIRFLKGDGQPDGGIEVFPREGKIEFDGDTNLYRSAADVLKTDDNFDCLALRIGGTEVITSGRVLQNIASVAQSLLPDTDNTRDLGSSSYRWKRGYFYEYLWVYEVLRPGIVERFGSWGNEPTIPRLNNVLALADQRFTVTVSATPTSGGVANMFDHSFESSTRWDTTVTYPVTIEIDLGGTYHYFTAVGVYFVFGRYPGYVKIEIYNTNTSAWETLKEVSGNTSSHVYWVGGQSYVGKIRITLDEPTANPHNEIAVALIYAESSALMKVKGGGHPHFPDLMINGYEVITSGRILQNIASVAQSLLPNSDNAYDLGSSSYRWRNVYLRSRLYISGTGNLEWSLHSNGEHLEIREPEDGDKIWFKMEDGVGIHLNPDGTQVLSILTGQITPYKSIVPSSDNALDLGSSSYRWRNGYFSGNVNLSDTSLLKFGTDVNLYRESADVLKTEDNFNCLSLRIRGTEVINQNRRLRNIASVEGPLLPSSSGAYNLGSSVYKWDEVHANDVYGTVRYADMHFLDLRCKLCGKSFKVGDRLELIVTGFEEDPVTGTEMLAVPVHVGCAVKNSLSKRVKSFLGWLICRIAGRKT